MTVGVDLASSKSLAWKPAKPPAGLEPSTVLIGSDSAGLGLQVAVAEWTGTGSPTREALAALHKDRLGKRVFPLVVLAVTSEQGWMLGPSPDAAVIGPLPRGQAERLLQAALDEPTGLAARQRLGTMQRAVESTAMPGVVNTGLFATYYLTESVPQRDDWEEEGQRARPWMAERGERLIRSLGFATKKAAGSALLLTGGSEAPHAVAVLLDASEQFDQSSPKYQVSPVAWGLQVAARNEVPWLMVLRGSQIRLYPAKPGVGVGRKGQVETWFELDLALLSEQDAAFLALVFSADALAPGGTVEELLAGSKQYATALGERLRDRVYVDVVPVLATAVAGQLPTLGLPHDATGLDRAYKLTLRILFRLLFQAYAEDRGLLPYGRNPRYDRNALKTVAHDLVENPGQEFDPESRSLWDDLQQVWRVIDSGDKAWNVPAYNGGLFGSDPELRPDGALLARLSLTNDVIGPVLSGLLVDTTSDGTQGAVDFRSLSVREFGTIYEGLLESTLSVAPEDLAVDAKGRWVPAKRGDEVVVPAGQVYFHSASGERKATGSYFTPDVVVEHLLDRALEPVLADHLDRVAALLDNRDEAGAATALFDLRVADLAMGSGHFLVAAVDRIETRMRDFLTEHPIPQVTAELRRLQTKAEDALGDDAAVVDVEPAALLRRQIARRCIYGIDVNPLAVELARLGLWISTFVPGLPMSSLDHGLVCADSLTGVGTLDEALEVLDPGTADGTISLFAQPILDELAEAKTLLQDAAASSEADKAEVHAAAEVALLAREAAEPARHLLDAVVAARLGLVDPTGYDPDGLIDAVQAPAAADAVRRVRPAHMPFLFPEVLLRDNPGFDCLIGNPPWEKLKVERHSWWWLRYPGLRGMPVAKRNAEIKELEADRPDLAQQFADQEASTAAARRLASVGPYPGVGSGDIDLYKLFAWRNWHLIRGDGAFGLVLPQGALNGSGTSTWRSEILRTGEFVDACYLVNNRKWIFPVHSALVCGTVAAARRAAGRARTVGPFHSEGEFLGGRDRAAVINRADILSWSDTAAFPMVPDETSAELMRLMKRHPRFDAAEAFEFRPHRELDATNDKEWFDPDLEHAQGDLPVYAGASFYLWEPDYGPPYAYAQVRKLTGHLLDKAHRGARHSRSAFHGMRTRSGSDLPMQQARIAFRDVTKNDNTRTTVVCLIPPRSALVHNAPYLLRREGTEVDEAYLLGVMASVPFDWYSRRWVGLHMTFELLGPMPVPRPPREDPLRQRVTAIAGALGAVDERFAQWAAAVRVPVGSVTTESEKNDLIAELDALVARLYGLSAAQVEHVFATFHRGWEFRPRLEAVLSHYTAWKERM